VDLLPALGESGLYEIMDLKKPWNHLDLSKEVDNRLISQRSVTILTCPADTSGNRNRTNYFAVRGKDTCWPDEKLTLADVSDGPSGTLVLLESHTLPTVWSQPQDLDFHKMRYEVNGAGAGISSPHGATANAAFVDGSIHALSNKIDPQVLEELLHRRDGNPHVKSGWNK
jgi:prepilin-type processing-associated H-X9-DG protein